MKYIKAFEKDYKFLKEHGMSEAAIEDFYTSFFHKAYLDDEWFRKHSVLFDPAANPDSLAYQRGTPKKKTEAEKADVTGWSAIKMTIVPLAVNDTTDCYIEHVQIVEQIGDRELQAALWSLSKDNQFILELLLDGWAQKDIAKKLNLSNAAISNHVAVIRKAVEPYYRTRGWLKVK